MKKIELFKNEILEAIHTFAGSVDQRFDKIELEMGSMKQEMGSMKAQMVTKDYLDDKLADLRGDLMVIARKSDQKDSALVKNLAKNKVISKDEAGSILAMSPFSRQ
jgi:hypothetical protein